MNTTGNQTNRFSQAARRGITLTTTRTALRATAEGDGDEATIMYDHSQPSASATFAVVNTDQSWVVANRISTELLRDR